jgi:hypothetical protein
MLLILHFGGLPFDVKVPLAPESVTVRSKEERLSAEGLPLDVRTTLPPSANVSFLNVQRSRPLPAAVS